VASSYGRWLLHASSVCIQPLYAPFRSAMKGT
jgi:hypothetical protein